MRTNSWFLLSSPQCSQLSVRTGMKDDEKEEEDEEGHEKKRMICDLILLCLYDANEGSN